MTYDLSCHLDRTHVYDRARQVKTASKFLEDLEAHLSKPEDYLNPSSELMQVALPRRTRDRLPYGEPNLSKILAF